jgi:hypothetical protein
VRCVNVRGVAACRRGDEKEGNSTRAVRRIVVLGSISQTLSQLVIEGGSLAGARRIVVELELCWRDGLASNFWKH